MSIYHKLSQLSRASDPQAENILKLLGGESYEGNSFTREQVKHFARVYEVELPQGDNPEVSLEKAMTTRNLLRCVKVDGMRLMAFLAKWCEAGEDPVKVLVRMAEASGFDVGDLMSWAEGEEPGAVEDDS